MDWDGTLEDLELFWELKQAIARSVELGQLGEFEEPEPAIESEPAQSFDIPPKDVELPLVDVDADRPETEIDREVEKTEDAE